MHQPSCLVPRWTRVVFPVVLLVCVFTWPTVSWSAEKSSSAQKKSTTQLTPPPRHEAPPPPQPPPPSRPTLTRLLQELEVHLQALRAGRTPPPGRSLTREELEALAQEVGVGLPEELRRGSLP